jgi:HK97 family phage portal protein
MRNPFETAARQLRERKATGPVANPAAILAPGRHNSPIWTDWNTDAAITDGFKASVWVYRCVRKLMDAAAAAPMVAYVKGAKGWKPDHDHEMTALLEHPNPHMTRAQLVETMTAQMQLGGNTVLWKNLVRNGTKLQELWPFDVRYLKPIPVEQRWIGAYEYTIDGVARRIPAEECAHALFVHPGEPFWGISPLQAAAKVVDTDVEAVGWNKTSFQNRAVPAGVLTMAQPISEDQREEIVERLKDHFVGAANARRPAVLGNGTTYQAIGLTPVEMDFIESRKWGVQEIAAAFGVPLPVLGILSDATFANYEIARRIFWEDTVAPFLKSLADALGRSLVPHFGDPRTLAVGFDLTDIAALRDDYGKKVDQLEKLVRSGVPINAAIEKLEMDLKPVEGGDQGFIPATMVPVTLAGQEPAGTDDPDQPL